METPMTSTPCPSCGDPLAKAGIGRLVTMLTLSMGVLMWIPIIGWIGIIFIAPLTLLLAIFGLFRAGRRGCLTCGWKGTSRQATRPANSTSPSSGTPGAGDHAHFERRKPSEEVPCPACGKESVSIPQFEAVQCPRCGLVPLDV